MITKTRSSQQVVYPTKVTQAKATPWIDPPTGFPNEVTIGTQGSVLALDESITYGVHERNNPCTHRRKHVVLMAGDVSGIYYLTSYPTKGIIATFSEPGNVEQFHLKGIAGAPTNWAWPAVPTIDAGMQTEASWRALSSRALQVMWPKVQSNVSTLNFLVELRELKHLPLQIVKILRGLDARASEPLSKLLRKLYRNPSQRRKGYRAPKSELGLRAQAVGGTVLLSEYGINPLVSDLSALQKALRVARSEAFRLQNYAGKELRSHARFWVPPPATTSNTYVNSVDWPNFPTSHNRRVEWLESWYTATLDYTYSLPASVLANLKALTLLDVLGINLNPRIVWDAVPWTFVVDWLLKVGDFLDQFKSTNVTPIVKVLQFCHSYKVKRRIERKMCVNYKSTLPNVYQLTGYEDETVYIREPYIPSYYSALQLSGMSTREFVLAGALATTR